MTKKPIINDDFIREWHPKYLEHDEEDYRKIMKAVFEEVSRDRTISMQTLEEIVDWKAARAKGYLKLKNFGDYEATIKKMLKISKPDQKVALLDDLPGIGIPIASTILHFVNPKIFPIVDFRTVEVLLNSGHLSKSKSLHYYRNTAEGYSVFNDAVAKIAQQHPKWSLRQIDRALFAYHKSKMRAK